MFGEGQLRASFEDLKLYVATFLNFLIIEISDRFKFPHCFTNYLEPGYKEEQILIETCEAVTEKKEDTEFIKFKEFPEIQAACIYHKGSYNNFPRTYAMILKYIEESGYEICGSIREKYIDGIWNKDTEDEWLSEIQIPVKKLKNP